MVEVEQKKVEENLEDLENLENTNLLDTIIYIYIYINGETFVKR